MGIKPLVQIKQILLKKDVWLQGHKEIGSGATSITAHSGSLPPSPNPSFINNTRGKPDLSSSDKLSICNLK